MKNVTRNVSQKLEVIKNYIKVAKTRKEKMPQNDNKSKMKLRESIQIRVVSGTKLKSKLRSLQEPFNIDLSNLSDLTNYV